MAFKVTLRNKTYDFEGDTNVRKILKRININPESYLVVRNGKLLTEDDVIKDGEEIKIIAVISGGSD